MVDLAALVTASPADWMGGVQDVAQVLTLFIAAVAIIPAWVAIVKTTKSNRQGRWWNEVQWALDAAFSENAVKQKAGIRMIFILSREKWLGKHELQVLDSAWEQSLTQAAAVGLRGKAPGSTEEGFSAPEGLRGAESAPGSAAPGEVQVEAAKLRVALDARMERETPAWIKDKAEE